MKKTANMQNDINQFMSKVKAMEKGHQLDLSSDEDLSMAIMNLISMEEHFFFTYSKTKDERYLDLLDEVRQMRKAALKRIIKDYEGEVWCISKHLLAASMRYMEVGTKALGKGDKKGSKEMFDNAYKLYSLFWGLNLNLVGSSDLKKVKQSKAAEISFINEEKKPKKTASVGILEKLGEVIKKTVDCCKE